MKKILFFCASFLLLAACSRAPQFEVSGTITDAQGETLYLEHTGLTATEVEDSCLLSSDGSYCLHGAAPEFPDFYRLRMINESGLYWLSILLSIFHSLPHSTVSR